MADQIVKRWRVIENEWNLKTAPWTYVSFSAEDFDLIADEWAAGRFTPVNDPRSDLPTRRRAVAALRIAAAVMRPGSLETAVDTFLDDRGISWVGEDNVATFVAVIRKALTDD